jgi:Holliday junction resolvase
MDRWRTYCQTQGLHTVRIENVGCSLADIMFVWKGVVVFQEVKMRRGNLIYMPIYQWSNMVRLRRSMYSWQLLYVVYNSGVFDIYTIDQIKMANPESAGKGKIKAHIGMLVPILTITNMDDFALQFVPWIASKAWKKKT